MREKRAIYINGYAGIVGLVVLALVSLLFFHLGVWQAKVWVLFSSIFLWLIASLLLGSATVVSPGQAKVISFFGQYSGTIRENGFFLTISLTQKMTVSLKARNFDGSVLKVDDLDGDPIEISAAVVSKVIDTAKVPFDVVYYQDFVEIQSKTATRHIASQYPYDIFNDDDLTLRGNTTAVSDELKKELQGRLVVVDVEVTGTRLNHLAYATETASAMLQRRQARAILFARQTIVEGAATITQMALE